MKRIQAFDVGRGIAVVMVVFLHATLLPQNTVHLEQPVCRMALLLLISGVLAAPALDRDWAYSRKRILDLLWMYALWTPIILIVRDGKLISYILAGELIAPTSHLWYIGGLALLILSLTPLRRVNPLAPIILAAVASTWHTMGGRTGILGYDQLSHFAVFFYLGLYGHQHVAKVVARCGGKIGVIAAAAMAFVLFAPVPHTLATMGSAAALLFVAQGLSQTKAGPVIGWLGRNTPGVYLAHYPVLLIAGRLTGPIGVLGLVILPIGTIALCLALRCAANHLGLEWLYQRPALSRAPATTPPKGRSRRLHGRPLRPGRRAAERPLFPALDL